MKQYVYDVVFSIKKRITLEVPANNEEIANEKLHQLLEKEDEDSVYLNGETVSLTSEVESVSEYRIK